MSIRKEPEELARDNIDKQLKDAGWIVQHYKDLNLGAGLGVAVGFFPLATGEADYLLFVDRKAIGVIEAKAEGITLSGVTQQSDKYLEGLKDTIPCYQNPLPFAYESTGVETFFRNTKDSDFKSRRVFSFHKPSTLLEWVQEEVTLRDRLKLLPELDTKGLRDCQIEAVTNLEESFACNRERALIQMATGSGKTFTAITFIYRLIKFSNAKRILFLVDRGNLGRQTLKEFQQYITPDDGRKFTELYNVQHLKSNTVDPVCKVCITTIQRLYSMLRGEAEFEADNEEVSLYDLTPDGRMKEVVYNQQMPIEYFDFVVTDECHRSIYNLWRQVLDYYDSFLIGLTATPSKQTLGFFNKNLVMEYSHERAVADGVNVGYDIYRIKTKMTDEGSEVEAGNYVDVREKDSRRLRWEQLDEDLAYKANQLDRDVVAPDQIRTVIRTFKEKLSTEIFPGRDEVPKTLIFAKDDSHAEDIVHIIRDEFGKGNDFCKKITYRTQEKPEELIASFRNSYNPRIAVTVDMISTGTDIKPIECLVFMRDVRSKIYFEQMIGRGTRTINSDDLKAVTSDAETKTHFMVVDAIGVCESNKIDTRPLEKKPGLSFEKLINLVAMGNTEPELLSSLANRLTRLDKSVSTDDKKEITDKAKGQSLSVMVNQLLDAVDPDKSYDLAKTKNDEVEPSIEQINEAKQEITRTALNPFDDPKLRLLLCDIKKKNEQTIDNVSIDEVTFAGFDENAKEKAQSIVGNFQKFIEDNKDEITALQIIFNQPYKKRHLTYEHIKELSKAITRPPYNLNENLVWHAYEQLEKSKVKKAGPQKILTNIVSLVRYATGKEVSLEPFKDSVDKRFQLWLKEQTDTGTKYNQEQLQWLNMIKEHIATSISIEDDDFNEVPFNQQGGIMKATQIFGDKFKNIIEELNERLVA